MKHKQGKGKPQSFKIVVKSSSSSNLSLKQQKRNKKRQEKLLPLQKSSDNVFKKDYILAPQINATSVYKRGVSYPGSSTSVQTHGFLSQSHPNFMTVLEQSYQGVAVEPVSMYPSSFSISYREALEALGTAGFYQYDMTQPAGLGTKISRTFVTRCLVGDPGMTYKYLGLRMFAHPWIEGAVGANIATIAIGRLNSALKERAIELNQKVKSRYGSCEFNLTLINYCLPMGEGPLPLKREPLFSADNMSVSWHADSSLDHYSTIAVYHWDKQDSHIKPFQPWRIALKVAINAEGPQQGKPLPPSSPEITAPPIAISMPPEGCYYLLDDFNHHHQHAVLAGSSHRFASTHRVSRVEGHSFTSIHTRCQNILLEKLKADKAMIRRVLLASIEVEFEWIQQFYIQGAAHYNRLVWWHEPIKQLLEQLLELEKRIVKVFFAVKTACLGAESVARDTSLSAKQLQKIKALSTTVTPSVKECAQEMLLLSQERVEKRIGWQQRAQDPIFLTCSEDCQPVAPPLAGIADCWRHVGGLDEAIDQLGQFMIHCEQ